MIKIDHDKDADIDGKDLAALRAKKKKPKSNKERIPKMNPNLFGLIVISVAAFFGFGAIFSQMQLNLGAQASSAAFAALFIILSTKFLMEKESENKLLSDKQYKVFESHLEHYSEASEKMLIIMEEYEITQTKINGLMHSYANLIILGDVKAIDAFAAFIEKCQKILSKVENSGMTEDIDSHDHFVDGRLELWKKIVEFQKASRDSLNLNSNDLNQKEITNRFQNFIKEQDNIDSRKAIKHNLEQWLVENSSLKKDKDTEEFEAVKENTQELIEIIKSAGLKETIKTSQISFRNPKHKTSARVIYLNSYAHTKKTFNLSSASTKNFEFFEKYTPKLKGFSPNIVHGKKNIKANPT